MYYITGDTHGSQSLWQEKLSRFLKQSDTIIVPGDFGIGFYNGRYLSEEFFLDYLEEQDFTILFCDGNHESFDKLSKCEVSLWNNGKVHRVRKNVIHLMRGEIYDIDGRRVFVMGGGYSIDKENRVPGESWWAEEMPSEAEYRYAADNLKKHDSKVDYIITHAAPSDTVEKMASLGFGIKSGIVEELPLNTFLYDVEHSVKYERWYFGHYHIDAELEGNQYALLNAVRDFWTGELVHMR